MALSKYDKYLVNSKSYLESELGEQRDIFLKDNGWTRMVPRAAGKKPVEDGLCAIYKFKSDDRAQKAKIRIFTSGMVKEYAGKEETPNVIHADWAEFLSSYRWPRFAK